MEENCFHMLTDWKRSVTHLCIQSHLIFVKAGVFILLLPTNQVCIMSLFFWFHFVYIMLLSACICFAFLLLKINCRRNLIQCLDLLELSYDSQDHPFVNDTFFIWIVIIIVGGECFIRSNWGQPFSHKWAHIKARREEKLLGLKVM